MNNGRARWLISSFTCTCPNLPAVAHCAGCLTFRAMCRHYSKISCLDPLISAMLDVLHHQHAECNDAMVMHYIQCCRNGTERSEIVVCRVLNLLIAYNAKRLYAACILSQHASMDYTMILGTPILFVPNLIEFFN